MTRRRKNQAGSASLEFALVAALYTFTAVLILCLSLTLGAKAVAEMTAWDTARCAAIGSIDCPVPDDFARALLRKWGGGFLAASVRVSATCRETQGTAVTLTFGTTTLADRLIGASLTANACFPAIPGAN